MDRLLYLSSDFLPQLDGPRSTSPSSIAPSSPSSFPFDNPLISPSLRCCYRTQTNTPPLDSGCLAKLLTVAPVVPRRSPVAPFHPFFSSRRRSASPAVAPLLLSAGAAGRSVSLALSFSSSSFFRSSSSTAASTPALFPSDACVMTAPPNVTLAGSSSLLLADSGKEHEQHSHNLSFLRKRSTSSRCTNAFRSRVRFPYSLPSRLLIVSLLLRLRRARPEPGKRREDREGREKVDE
jgi:hypothetical protein